MGHINNFANPLKKYYSQPNYSLTLSLLSELNFRLAYSTCKVMDTSPESLFKTKIDTVAVDAVICQDMQKSFKDRYAESLRRQWGEVREFARSISLLRQQPFSYQIWKALFEDFSRAGS